MFFLLSDGAHNSLCVAHVKDSNLEFIEPKQITETHVLVTTIGLSLFGLITEYFWGRNIHGLVVSFLQPGSVLKLLLLESNADMIAVSYNSV